MAAVIFGAVAAVELILVIALTLAAIRKRYNSFGELLPALIVDSVALFSGMYRHLTHIRSDSERPQNVWNLVMLYTILIGPILYYGFVYLRDVRAVKRG
jgi:hypothetical protein